VLGHATCDVLTAAVTVAGRHAVEVDAHACLPCSRLTSPRHRTVIRVMAKLTKRGLLLLLTYEEQMSLARDMGIGDEKTKATPAPYFALNDLDVELDDILQHLPLAVLHNLCHGADISTLWTERQILEKLVVERATDPTAKRRAFIPGKRGAFLPGDRSSSTIGFGLCFYAPKRLSPPSPSEVRKFHKKYKQKARNSAFRARFQQGFPGSNSTDGLEYWRDRRYWPRRPLLIHAPEDVTEELRPGEAHLLVPFRDRLLAAIGTCVEVGENGERAVDTDVRSSGGPQKRGRYRYGFAPHPVNGDPVLDVREAEIVRRMFSLYMAGFTDQKIAEQLNEDGLFDRSDKVWRRDRVAACLKDVSHKGQYKHRGKLFKVVPTVPEEVWNRVQTLRARLALNPGETSAIVSPHPLSGLLRCAVCGDLLVREPAHSEEYEYYRCRRTSESCKEFRTRQDSLESSVAYFLACELFAPIRAGAMLKALLDSSEATVYPIDEKVERFAIALEELFLENRGFARRLINLHVEKVTVDRHVLQIHWRPLGKESWPAPLWVLSFSPEIPPAPCPIEETPPEETLILYRVHTREGTRTAAEDEVADYRRKAAAGEVDLLIDAADPSRKKCLVVRQGSGNQRKESMLSHTQRDVLLALVRNRGTLLTVDKIKAEVGREVSDQHIRDSISTLRMKLGDTALIKAGKWGDVNYKFDPPEDLVFFVIERV